MNNNADLIHALRLAADYLDAHPGFPDMKRSTPHSIWHTVYSKDELLAAARTMGTYTKRVDETYYSLIVAITPALELRVETPRTTVCTKRTVWDCPDESLLKLFEDAQTPAAK